MKIKNFIIALMALIGLASCSKDGSRTIQLDEFASIKPESVYDGTYKKTSELFSIVPGEYTISWKVKDELPQVTNYVGTMVVKLKLNKKLIVNDDFIKEADYNYCPYFVFVDADGKELDEISHWHVSFDAATMSTNKDQFMDFVKFLQSEPGTEMEITFGTFLMENSGDHYAHQVSNLQNAKGIALYVLSDDIFNRHVAKFAE